MYVGHMTCALLTPRVCRWDGVLVVTDFDITLESLSPFTAEFRAKIEPLLKRVAQGEFDKVEAGIYEGEVRAWGVHGGP